MSNRAFAQKIGVSPSAVNQYLSGENEPTRPVLCAIAEQTGVSLDWLAMGRGSMRPETKNGFDEAKMKEIIRELETQLGENGLFIAPDKKAELVMALYDALLGQEKPVKPAQILRFLKLVG